MQPPISLSALRSYYSTPQNERSTQYYDTAFQQLLDNERPNRPNWAAGFFTVIWAMYRRQYELAFIISLMMQVVSTIEVLQGDKLSGLTFLLNIFMIFMLAFKGNQYYLEDIQKKIINKTAPDQIIGNTDQAATMAMIAYNILIGMFLVAGQNGQIENTETLSSKLLIPNWIGFILFWVVIYVWRIQPRVLKNRKQ